MLTSCEAVEILSYVVEIVCLFAVAGKCSLPHIMCKKLITFTGLVFNCLRIWAICRQRWFPAIVVFLLGIFTPGVNIV